MEQHILDTLDSAGILCRFDFAVGPSGASAGLAFPLAVPSRLVDNSPYSPHDRGEKGGLPQPDQLDYALLRLASAAGDDIINGEKRGWIPLMANAAPPRHKSIVFIGQHPELNPLKIAVGVTLQTNENGTRVRYDANTQRGSSGSPCLNAKLELVALHHAGDPDYSKLLGEYNQGIPIGMIVQQMASRGVPKFWG